ncbi:MAG: hypothetical protein AAF399_21060, partial [Bacteroidota bacterium]
MPNKSSIPHVVLACPDPTGKLARETAASQELDQVHQVLSRLVAETAIRLTDLRPGGGENMVQWLMPIKKADRKSYHLLHMSGFEIAQNQITLPTNKGTVQEVPLAKFAASLAKIPHLQMIILSGMPAAELTQELLKKGIPRVLVANESLQSVGIMKEYYRELVQGKTLQQAYDQVQALVEDGQWPLYQLTYDAKQD